MNHVASVLSGLQGERIVLRDVVVSAVLRDLLAEVTVSQTYRNDEQVNIEAVYTFPLPLDAVLLEVTVVIGGRGMVDRHKSRRTTAHDMSKDQEKYSHNPLPRFGG
jgi:Ca-activated chloride channel family protein